MKKSHIYQAGDPVTVNVDTKQCRIDVYVESTTTSINDLWSREFSQIPDITVLLSGGVDSQFSALLAQRHCENVNAVTFDLIWENHTVNVHDVCAAQRFVKTHRIPHTVVEVDLKECLDNQLSRIAQQYHCTSPQIATHVYCIEQLLLQTSPGCLLMGAEQPMIPVENHVVIAPGLRQSVNGTTGTNNARFSRFMLPFLVAEQLLQTKIIRDPFCMNPQILYQGYMHNAQVFEHKKIFYEESDKLRTDHIKFKEAYYDLLAPGKLCPPLLKRTGFETLKYAMAAETGIYNQFDKKYRQPMEDRFRNSDLRFLTNVPWIHGPVDEILAHCQQSYEQQRPKPCNYYRFDW